MLSVHVRGFGRRRVGVAVRTGSAQTCSLFDGVPLTHSTAGYLYQCHVGPPSETQSNLTHGNYYLTQPNPSPTLGNRRLHDNTHYKSHGYVDT